jgi:hypothetical protein
MKNFKISATLKHTDVSEIISIKAESMGTAIIKAKKLFPSHCNFFPSSSIKS